MIAHAMDPAPAEALLYADLARRGLRISRSLSADQLPRLTTAVEALQPVAVELAFEQDDAGRCRVTGLVKARIETRCLRCAEVLPVALEAAIDCRVVDSEAVADELAPHCDIVLAASNTVDLAALVEDELLLELPESLCETDPCERAPGLWYPAEGATSPGEASRPNPFAALEVLKTDDPERTD